MKETSKPLSWKVKNFDYNKQIIEDYDVLKHREDFIKMLKKECSTKDQFSRKMHTEFMYRFWARSEYELIVEIDSNNHVWLVPWCGCRNNEAARIDVTNSTDFDWVNFAKKHINKQIFENKAKIDVYYQLDYKWEEFIDYCWYTRLKYERKNSKFDR